MSIAQKAQQFIYRVSYRLYKIADAWGALSFAITYRCSVFGALLTACYSASDAFRSNINLRKAKRSELLLYRGATTARRMQGRTQQKNPAEEAIATLVYIFVKVLMYLPLPASICVITCRLD